MDKRTKEVIIQLIEGAEDFEGLKKSLITAIKFIEPEEDRTDKFFKSLAKRIGQQETL